MNIQSYAWEAGRSRQVVYASDNLHINELYVVQGGGWSHADLTSRTGSPTLSEIGGHLTAFAWNEGRSKQVAYIGADRHIHELYVSPGGEWTHQDLHSLPTLSTAPHASDAKIIGFGWGYGHSKQILFQSVDGHIHELYFIIGGGWQHADLTALTRSPAPHVGKISAYAWETGRSKQVVYLTEDGHIHELSVSTGNWQHADLTIEALGAPPVPLIDLSSHPYGGGFLEPDLSAYAFEAGRSKQVLFRTLDGHLHELSCPVGGRWVHQDLHNIPTLADAPRAEFDIIAGYSYEERSTKNVVYSSGIGRIHELSFSQAGGWTHTDVTGSAMSPFISYSWLSGYASHASASKHIIYGDRTINQLTQLGGVSRYSDLTAATRSPLIR